VVPQVDAVHVRLEQWAAWANSGLESIGWPPSTLLGRMIDQGPTGAAQQGSPPITIPDEIAEVDSAVARLEPIDKGVISAYYLNWAPPEVLWMGCIGVRSAHSFRVILKRARWRIAGFIAQPS
jgi:hypothetical protein